MIYTVSNTIAAGKPMNVFVNGNKVARAVYADTAKGIVKYNPTPVRIKKGTDEVYTRVLKGVVTVEPIKK